MTAQAAGMGVARRNPLERVLAFRITLNAGLLVYVAIFAVAFALRFWDLGERALAHDESIHAQWSWRLLRGDYSHDPVFHGPLYYHAQGLAFFLFGTNDYVSRLSAAVFGMGMVALPLFLRRRLGVSGTIATMAFIALSPAIVYYARHIREDIYMAFFTLVMVVTMWRWIDEGRDRWLVVLALGLAGSMATKEATYLTAAVFLLYVNGHLALDLARKTLEDRGQPEMWRRLLFAAGLFPFAWAIAALWPFLGRIRQNAAWDEMPRPGDVLILIGTLMVPLLTPFLKGPLESLGIVEEGRLDWRSVCLAGSASDRMALTGLFAITVSGAAFIGLQWRPRTWLIAAGVAALTYLTLMTSFWTNLDGVCTGPWGSLDYWISQQGETRGNQPWYYYYITMPVYEFLPLAVCLAGAWWSLVRGDSFSRFCWFWMLGTWLLLSSAGEKMPWLTVHITLAACILAGWTVGKAWQAWAGAYPESLRRLTVPLISMVVVAAGAMLLFAFLPWSTPFHVMRLLMLALVVGFVVYASRPFGSGAVRLFAIAAVIGALSFFSVRTMSSINFFRLDEPRDMLMYAEISPDLPLVMDDIDRLARASGKGFGLRIAVDNEQTWPWPWYLRDYASHGSVTYADMTDGPPEGDWDVLIVSTAHESGVTTWLAETGSTRYASPRPMTHLWWPDETYKQAITTGPFKTFHLGQNFTIPYAPEWSTWADIIDGFVNQGWTQTTFEYWRDREPPNGNIEQHSLVFFPSNFDQETGRMIVEPLEAPGPTTDDEGRPMFGGFGNLPGQFIAPVDAEADAEGNLYVIDSATSKLQKFDGEGNFLASVDIRDDPADPAEDSEPWGLGIAPDGSVVVADTFGWRVRVFSSELEPLTSFGEPPAEGEPGDFNLFGPRDIAFDDDGNMWVTDTGHDRIMVYTLDGQFERQVGGSGSGPGEFDEPTGIARGPDGHMYVADVYNARVQVLATDGSFVREFPVPGWGQDAADKPYLDVLGDGRVAVSMPLGDRVEIFDAEGNRLVAIGETPTDSLTRPYGIVWVGGDSLWISEGTIGRLRLFEIPR